ncbi:ribosome-binding factor A [Candidatus Parcubacteria bacterium]|uniref:Ribosome-binding factor A n=1 Tax=Candidatus Kaiserbacteria bacterium CG10_big_fil_rev_8_21_14_0_10_47_16 TaxID=1974608 RepID=A0A2H0UDA6_9BACT|nr:ribosome-binding factor A [Candidatus Parcubacteria bacterium]PIR84404.1 MAG: hypothetical protein COU16_02355 [Candidatus Kaiserbacteria bacterium CG10_big_fil_rev_8_21_14_0_10_47_16]
MPDFDRHDRINSILATLAAEFIRVEANSNPLITVTHVTISPDYRRTTIGFTTIPEDKQDDALIFLKRNASEFRNYIKKHAHLKFIPHIEFAIDYGERHRQHIDDVVRDIEEGKK